MEAVLERTGDGQQPSDEQPPVKFPLTRLLDLLAGWSQYTYQDDLDGIPDAPAVGERIAELYQEAGNLEASTTTDAETLLRSFLQERVLPVLMQTG